MWQEKHNPSFGLSPLRPHRRRKDESLQAAPPPHPLPRNRRAFQRRLCVHFSCAAPSVFNTLQRPSDYPEYFSMTWDEFFSLGAVSPTPGVTERRAKPHRDLMTVPSRVQDERTEDPERTSRNGFIKPDPEAEALVCVT